MTWPAASAWRCARAARTHHHDSRLPVQRSDAPGLPLDRPGLILSLLPAPQFLPKSNPVHMAATATLGKALGWEKNGPARLNSLPTRVSQAGNIFIRLPPGSLV